MNPTASRPASSLFKKIVIIASEMTADNILIKIMLIEFLHFLQYTQLKH